MIEFNKLIVNYLRHQYINIGRVPVTGTPVISRTALIGISCWKCHFWYSKADRKYHKGIGEWKRNSSICNLKRSLNLLLRMIVLGPSFPDKQSRLQKIIDCESSSKVCIMFGCLKCKYKYCIFIRRCLHSCYSCFCFWMSHFCSWLEITTSKADINQCIY